MDSKKLLLTLHPAVYRKLQEKLKDGYGSVQEVINELLRKEFMR
jgi:predicted CopG family antitoxin